MAKTVYLIGLGYKPLSPEEKVILKKVSKIFSFKGTLKIFERYPVYKDLKKSIEVVERIEKLIEKIKSTDNEVSVLAGGDPLFFGIGERLLEVFPKDSIRIYPDLTTPQILCRSLKIPFYKVRVYSLHGRTFTKEAFLREVAENQYLFVYTDMEQNPSFIAKLLIEEGFDRVVLHIGEKLGSHKEMIFSGKPEDFFEKKFLYPNSCLIENPEWGKAALLGFRKNEIIHKNGMITKDEVRAIILHKLRPHLRGIIWDIGAGSGSISLELAKLSPHLEIYAIEKNKDYCKIIEENCKKFKIPNVKIVCEEAPEVLDRLPKPDRVFVGGSSGKLRKIFHYLEGLTKTEILVFSFITLENLYEAYNFYKEKKIEPEILQVQVNRLKSLKDFLAFKAENPIFLLVVSKI